MAKQYDKKLVFSDGTEYFGYGFGDDRERVAVIAFNTSMVGYQEVFQSAVYAEKILLLTYPLIGNVGVVDEDFEWRNPSTAGLIVREYFDTPYNFRYSRTLGELMQGCGIPAIEGVDTRAIYRKVIKEGAGKVMIANITTPTSKALEMIEQYIPPRRVCEKISCKKKWYSRNTRCCYNVVALDCGIKKSCVKALKAEGCNLTVVPFNISLDEILELRPDGVFVSGGPDTATELPEVVQVVKGLIGRLPVYGIGVGAQAVCLAYNAKLSKLQTGHHGSNHPIKNLRLDKIETATQNHNYTVDRDSLQDSGLEVTHINLLDGSVEGVCSQKDRALATFFEPNSTNAGGENQSVFNQFALLMKEAKDA